MLPVLQCKAEPSFERKVRGGGGQSVDLAVKNGYEVRYKPFLLQTLPQRITDGTQQEGEG